MAIHGTLDPYASDDMRRDLPKKPLNNSPLFAIIAASSIF